jgi:hypothetical protein
VNVDTSFVGGQVKNLIKISETFDESVQWFQSKSKSVKKEKNLVKV